MPSPETNALFLDDAAKIVRAVANGLTNHQGRRDLLLAAMLIESARQGTLPDSDMAEPGPESPADEVRRLRAALAFAAGALEGVRMKVGELGEKLEGIL